MRRRPACSTSPCFFQTPWLIGFGCVCWKYSFSVLAKKTHKCEAWLGRTLAFKFQESLLGIVPTLRQLLRLSCYREDEYFRTRPPWNQLEQVPLFQRRLFDLQVEALNDPRLESVNSSRITVFQEHQLGPALHRHRLQQPDDVLLIAVC